MDGLLSRLLQSAPPAASMDGNIFVIAAQNNGLPTDMDTLNKIVNLVNNGVDVNAAASMVANRGMMEMPPSQGGLNASNYNNPYQSPNIVGGGLRAYPLPQGGYGGEMLPKSVGFIKGLKGTGKFKGEDMTEYSTGDERGDFPSIVPTLSTKELKQILSTGVISKSAFKKAQEHANKRRDQGLSPFYNEVSAGNR
jgi:hypothetical protein